MTLDLSKRSRIAPVLHIRQGDVTGTTLVATITDDHQPTSITGKPVTLCIGLPGHGGYYECYGTASGSTATFAIDETVAGSVAGRTDNAYVRVTDGESELSTESFTVIVLPDATEGAEPGSSWTSGIDEALQEMLEAAEAAQQAVEDIADAVDDAEAAVTAAEQAVTDAQSAVTSANTAVSNANTAVSNANAATTAAQSATTDALAATTAATQAASAATSAAGSANTAAANVGSATSAMVGQVNAAITRADAAADTATYAASDAEQRINAAIAACGDVSQLAVPLMSADIRGGARLGQGLSVANGYLTSNAYLTTEVVGGDTLLTLVYELEE